MTAVNTHGEIVAARPEKLETFTPNRMQSAQKTDPADSIPRYPQKIVPTIYQKSLESGGLNAIQIPWKRRVIYGSGIDQEKRKVAAVGRGSGVGIQQNI